MAASGYVDVPIATIPLAAVAYAVRRSEGTVMQLQGLIGLTEIGRGGFGVVYRGRQPEFDRDVAVKVLTGAARDAQIQRRFRAEAAAMGRLSGHPHILDVYGSGFTPDGQPYLVMPYMPRGSLQARLESRGRLPWEEALDIGVKVCGALATAHRSGLIHRDVKPDNILFNRYGEPQLADFGIVRLPSVTKTATGQITASVLYAAPEVLSGQQATTAADTYSLAATLVAAIRGAPAFADDGDRSLAPLLMRVVTQDPPELATLSVPDALTQVLHRGMAKEPHDRYETALGLGEALRSAQAQLGRRATPLTVPDPEDLPDPDATVRFQDAHPAIPNGSTPPGQQRRRRTMAVIGAAAVVVVVTAAGMAMAGRQAAVNDQAVTGDVTGEDSARSSEPTATDTASPATPAQETPTAGVTAERESRGVLLFEDAIDAVTPYYNDMLTYVTDGGVDAPEEEAALSGSWWALADWCVEEGHGREGVCYDLASEFLVKLFERDPREINFATWGRPGAIGGVLASTYELTARYLGTPDDAQQLPDLVDGRPGDAILCEPSCTAVLD